MDKQNQNTGSTSKRHQDRKLRTDSALLLAVRDTIATFVEQKGATSTAVLLAQVPDLMGPMVLQAIEDLALDGAITVCGKSGSLRVAWNGAQEGEA